jgi:hypothetical protein
VNYRAGTVTISSGTNNVAVSWTTGLSSANYQVAITPQNSTGGFSTTSNCLMFNVSSKSTTGFTITLRQCSNGSAHNTDTNLVLDWIAMSSYNP